MATELTTVTYTCDWTDEHGDVCGDTNPFSGRGHEKSARDAGWGRYTNAYLRRTRWETGINLWFCPVHATLFRNNHGWGDLETYGPPTKLWQSVFKVRNGP